MSLDEAIIPGNRPAAKWPGGTDLNLLLALTFVHSRRTSDNSHVRIAGSIGAACCRIANHAWRISFGG
jgi:hypothetical protein